MQTRSGWLLHRERFREGVDRTGETEEQFRVCVQEETGLDFQLGRRDPFRARELEQEHVHTVRTLSFSLEYDWVKLNLSNTTGTVKCTDTKKRTHEFEINT